MRALLAAVFMFAASIAAPQDAGPRGQTGRRLTLTRNVARSAARRTPRDVQKVFIINHVGVNDLVRVLFGLSRGTERAWSATTAASSPSPPHPRWWPPSKRPSSGSTCRRLRSRAWRSPPTCSSAATSGEPGTLPQELQGVLVQLKKTFSYSGCALARTLFTRGSDGNRFYSEFNERSAGMYSLSATRLEVEATNVVRLRGLELTNSVPRGAASAVTSRCATARRSCSAASA